MVVALDVVVAVAASGSIHVVHVYDHRYGRGHEIAVSSRYGGAVT
jgi:hypothetical protein